MCNLCSLTVFKTNWNATWQAVKDNFYVEDILLSVHATKQASEVFNELKPLLAKAVFNLTKLFSKFEKAFENSDIKPTESEDSPKFFGLDWIADDDV